VWWVGVPASGNALAVNICEAETVYCRGLRYALFDR
jgi:hypothetical protein